MAPEPPEHCLGGPDKINLSTKRSNFKLLAPWKYSGDALVLGLQTESEERVRWTSELVPANSYTFKSPRPPTPGMVFSDARGLHTSALFWKPPGPAAPCMWRPAITVLHASCPGPITSSCHTLTQNPVTPCPGPSGVAELTSWHAHLLTVSSTLIPAQHSKLSCLTR